MRNKFGVLLLCCCGVLSAQCVDQQEARVESLLQAARTLPADSNRVIFYGHRLAGTPYVANTLDGMKQECMVVNTAEVDCMTFVEYVLALTLCDRDGEYDYKSFVHKLQRIRYRNGRIDGYASRLHYFSDWMMEAEKNGFLNEVTHELPGAKLRTFYLNFMSEHADSYKALKNDSIALKHIAMIEQNRNPLTTYYIDKERLNLSKKELKIENGDLLALTTAIQGLDVVHLGFAYWKNGKLHLLHASMKEKQVIFDEISLYDYLKNRKKHTGVRVGRCC